uniref:Toxin candidate TRINITY_DN16965_c0_g1_i1 n=1 Tax=Isarachnanthus nocturnus TaxID=1240238 RepID=A0A7G7WZ36_9CNID|nr:toxin candidate TRINITY_DN16965_c0_g1_i1 [Isarachnanthus nocturnus]
MKLDTALQGLLLLMTVLASADEFSDFLSVLNNQQEDTSRVSRAYRGKGRSKKVTLPPPFSKIMTGQDLIEEEKYECKDDLPHCELWKDLCNDVHDREFVRPICKKTCNVCVEKPPPAPIACQISEHGCCWDGFSVAQGPNQEGCPECLEDQYSILCLRFRDYCLKTGRNREWVRNKCPSTCINTWRTYAEKTRPKEDLKENLVYNAWRICYSGESTSKRDELSKLLDGLSKMK